ncbi:MAG: hypothetical protein ACREYC_21470 [Gammaproteobacteria bacterium]
MTKSSSFDDTASQHWAAAISSSLDTEAGLNIQLDPTVRVSLGFSAGRETQTPHHCRHPQPWEAQTAHLEKSSPLLARKRSEEIHVVMQTDLVAQLGEAAREVSVLRREKVVVARAGEEKVRA